MRRVVAVELLSVDGIFESPEEWAFAYSDEEMEKANATGMAASDAMLLGRVTYEGWPPTGRTSPVAHRWWTT